MTAAAANRGRTQQTLKHTEYTLASGNIAYKGARAMLNPVTGKVQPATGVAGLVPLGVFDEYKDASSADKLVSIDLEREIQVEWWINGTSTNAIAATDVGKMAFHLDDQTVSILSAGLSPAGRIRKYDSTRDLVAVERLSELEDLGSVPAVSAFASNDYVVPATTPNDSILDIPTTGAASTVTLPAAAPDGTRLTFVADGTKNGHTVQYRDATGPVNLTTALTASKRHEVICVKRDGLWFANAYISP